MERGADPLAARDHGADRLRQHRRPEAVRMVADLGRPAVGRDLRRGRLPAGRAQHRHARVPARPGRSARSSSSTRPCAGSTSPARRTRDGRSPRRRAATSSASCSSSAATTRCSSSRTPTSTTPSTPPPSARSSTRARSACRPAGSSSSGRSPTTFVDRLVEKTKGLKAGDPKEHDTIIGPLINEEALATVKGRVDDAVAKGARVLVGGEADGPNYQATLLADVPEDSEFATRRDLRAGRGDRDRGRRRRGGRARERHAVRPRGRDHHQRSRQGARRSRSGSSRESSTSTTSRSATSRRCRSAASRTAAGAGSAAAPRWTSSPSCAGSRCRAGTHPFPF